MNHIKFCFPCIIFSKTRNSRKFFPVKYTTYTVLLDTDYYGHSSLHYLCSGLIESGCVTEVYNKLSVPCDMPRIQQIPIYYTDSKARKASSKFLTLIVNVSKQSEPLVYNPQEDKQFS